MTGRVLVGYDRLLDTIGTEAERMTGSAAGADPEFDVPGCPGLTLGETVRHVGSMYRMVLAWLRTGERPSTWQREPDEGQPVEEYLLSGMRAVVDHLSAYDPEEGCTTWWPEHQAYGFWYRRLAHETTVHRFDVQGAAGLEPDRVPDDIALDGVDEILHLWFTHRLAALGVSGTRHGRIKVRSGGRAWLARATPTGAAAWRVEADDEPADGTITALPHDMYVWLWGRIPPHTQALTRAGSDDAIAQLWALLRLATR
ncbi:MAG TPA: maleylpyruvate isomerase N-terminal domain-containing protein [Actinophytocola sp.]|uniref:maleylpyruvate isomerase N-terminal domain-containing protein n=1 Tax=Actinophytocola sp. TaxID=1872138 RepID=UPI002DDDB22F|nr:maleylpyruvate isomerase N-terminal domain-containing protein [Actinophytocola sp.]HEV2782970.1 maleylpyruvate isomerase N-terminal domain-containing protein [Actinophytocola sp.]